MLTKAQLTEAFRCSRFGPAGSSPAGEGDIAPGSIPPQQAEDLARIGLEEFVDAVGRLALMAFRFQDPPELLPTLGFQVCDSAQIHHCVRHCLAIIIGSSTPWR